MYYKDSAQYTESEVKALHPNVSFSANTITELGYEVIFPTPQPTVTELQVVYQDGIELDTKGNRVVKWAVRDMFADTTIDGVTTTKAQHEAAYIVKLQAEATIALMAKFIGITDKYIQDKVDAYNVANNTVFEKIENFTKYAIVPTDSRNAISVRFLTWNGKIWDVVNGVRVSALTTGVIPTDAAFKAVLDAVVF